MRNKTISDNPDETFSCPHCKVEQAEHPENILLCTHGWEVVECDTCEKPFELTKYISIQYATYKIKKS